MNRKKLYKNYSKINKAGGKNLNLVQEKKSALKSSLHWLRNFAI